MEIKWFDMKAINIIESDGLGLLLKIYFEEDGRPHEKVIAVRADMTKESVAKALVELSNAVKSL